MSTTGEAVHRSWTHEIIFKEKFSEEPKITSCTYIANVALQYMHMSLFSTANRQLTDREFSVTEK